MEQTPGARFLLMLASLVVVVAGLKAAAPILVPFSLALFLAVVSMPIMFGLRRYGISAPMAILLTVMVDVLAFGGVITLGANSVGDLTEKLPRYRTAITDLRDDWTEWLVDRGVPVSEYITENLFNAEVLFDYLGSTLGIAASFLSVVFLVTLVMIFILAEATVFPYKFQAILGRERRSGERMTKTIGEVQAYLGIKTLVSLATGLCAGLLCWAMNLDFPVLLGMVAFVLNYVPTIGSIIAAVPAMVIALLLFGWGPLVVVGVGYLAINTVFGNLIEPSLLGRRLGLSTLVVVLSLLFWGWLWGPVGALLSVPLTMVLRIVLENTPDLRWIAVLLDKSPPQMVESDMLKPPGSPAQDAVTRSDTIPENVLLDSRDRLEARPTKAPSNPGAHGAAD